MARIGWFDAELESKSWFDSELSEKAWFDAELIDQVAEQQGDIQLSVASSASSSLAVSNIIAVS